MEFLTVETVTAGLIAFPWSLVVVPVVKVVLCRVKRRIKARPAPESGVEIEDEEQVA